MPLGFRWYLKSEVVWMNGVLMKRGVSELSHRALNYCQKEQTEKSNKRYRKDTRDEWWLGRKMWKDSISNTVYCNFKLDIIFNDDVIVTLRVALVFWWKRKYDWCRMNSRITFKTQSMEFCCNGEINSNFFEVELHVI